jgi:hypothetical protein
VERCFSQALAKPAQGVRRCPSEERKTKRVRLLCEKDSMKLAIAFKCLPPPERLAVMVDTFEDFPGETPSDAFKGAILALHAAATEQREAIEQLREMDVREADLADLDLPERYLWVLSGARSRVPNLLCGALIVGREALGGLRGDGLKVGFCCQALRKSDLLQKCISTCLAVGNFLNRGTKRSDALAVTLPDSLLKLDDLRSNDMSDSRGDDTPRGNGTPRGGGTESKGVSLLDFVAQVLVQDMKGDGKEQAQNLRTVASDLLDKVKGAQAVSLEEAEANCRQIGSEAERAWVGLQSLPQTSRVVDIAGKVHSIRDEAASAVKLVSGAKGELSKTQLWFTAKDKVPTEEWFGGWACFLEKLSQAFGRVSETIVATPASRAFSPSARARQPVENREVATAATAPAAVASAPAAASSAVAGPQSFPEASTAAVKPTYSLFPVAAPAVQKATAAPSVPVFKEDEDVCLGPGDIANLLQAKLPAPQKSQAIDDNKQMASLTSVNAPVKPITMVSFSKPKTYSLFPPTVGKENSSH